MRLSMRAATLLSCSAVMLSACGDSLVNQPAVEKEGTTTADCGTANAVLTEFSLDFGEILVGQSKTLSLALTNAGGCPLNVESISTSNAEFSTPLSVISIAGGGAATLQVTYAPLDYRADEGSLDLVSDDADSPNLSITLRGAPIVDGDGDGYPSTEAGGGDCDDDDPNVNPGAEDEWYDGDDSNCDGADEYDQDGDGFQTYLYNDEPSAMGGDCQDANPDMHPGAVDVWYDGIDSNCDGVDDFDKDEDGWRHPSGGGSDCDDEDPEINPDGAERINGADDDCDGSVDNDIPGWNADYRWEGTAAGDMAGIAITMGDLDDDGVVELIVGASGFTSNTGMVAIIEGDALPADGANLLSASNTITGMLSGDFAGSSLAFLEASGLYGDPYLVVGAPRANSGYGAVFILDGNDAMSVRDVGYAVAQISGAGGANGYYVGSSLSEDVDINGDGIEDLFGYYQISTAQRPVPYLWMMDGASWDSGSFTSLTLASATARWSTDGGGGIGNYNSRMDESLPRGGDLDGDGYDDMLFCDYLADYAGTNDGATWVLFGKTAGYSNSSAANIETDGNIATTAGTYERHGMLCAIQPDVDGDGDDELWVYTPGRLSLDLVEGGTHLRSTGNDPDDYLLASYAWKESGAEPNILRRFGDVTGDGVEEMALSLSVAGASQGEVRILDATASGEFDGASEVFAVIKGDNDTDLGVYNGAYGFGLNQQAGDLDGDRRLDFAVGDYGWGATGSENKGAVFFSVGR